MCMRSISFAVLFGGVILGATLALSFFHIHPLLRFASAVSSNEEYTTEPDALERGIYNEPKVSAANAVAVTLATSTRAVKVPVFIYHSVRPYITGESKYQDMYDVTPQLLEEQLKYIRDHGYATITFADVIANFDHGTSLPAKPVILSFDDGWRNEYKYAFPLLKKYGMKGTFFIFTNPIDHQKAHWVTWDEVKEMDAAGMEIGGHTWTHPVLTKITTDAGLDKEIARSKKILEDHLGHPIYAFAYPFGAKNDQVIAAVKRAGYVIARTTFSGVWNDSEHRLEFHGTLVSDHMSDFEKLLNKP